MLKYKKRSRLFGGSNISTSLLIILEVFAIVVGVLIGFMVNEWRENRNNQRIAAGVLENIAAEMTFNHQQIVANFAYYDRIIARIDSIVAEDPAKVEGMYGHQLSGWQGAQPPMLRSSAYQMALTTGIIKDFPLETATRLADIYNVQTVVERLDDSIIMRFTTDHGFAALPTIRHLFGIYWEVLPSVMLGYQEEGLVLLGEYGYNLELEESKLKERVDLYAGFSEQ